MYDLADFEGRLVLRRASITGESPVWCEPTQRLFWVDVQQPALHRLDPATGLDESWIMPAWAGCLALGGGAAEGSVLVGLRLGAYRFDLSTGALTLVAPAPYDPRRFFLNDGKCDRQGRFWVGPMRHALLPLVGEPGADKGPLWRLDGAMLVPQGKEAALSNGLAWSPDGRTMYHSDTLSGNIYAWDYEPLTGDTTRGRVSRMSRVFPDRMERRSTVKVSTGRRLMVRGVFCASTRTAKLSARWLCRSSTQQ